MRKGMIYLVLALMGAVLPGCSLAPGGSQIEKSAVTVIDTAREEIRAYNDKKADVYLELPCATSIGAYYRLDNAVKQEALTMLCSGKRSGEPDFPLTPAQ